jgi:redox-sensitive bicupin YhaK (pirin superfamily)
MDPPAYNDMTAGSIPSVHPAEGVTAKVIVGSVGGADALITPLVEVSAVSHHIAWHASMACRLALVGL